KRFERSTRIVMENNSDRHDWLDERMAALEPDGEWRPDMTRGLARLRERKGMTARPRRRWATVMAGTLVTRAGLIAYPTSRAFAQRCVAACNSEAAALHHALADFQRNPSISKLHYHLAHIAMRFFSSVSSDADVKTGRPRTLAPDFTLTGMDGKPVR